MTVDRNMSIVIDVVKSGFILTYPSFAKGDDDVETLVVEKEVFTSPRKLNQKLKEVIDAIGLASDAS